MEHITQQEITDYVEANIQTLIHVVIAIVLSLDIP